MRLDLPAESDLQPRKTAYLLLGGSFDRCPSDWRQQIEILVLREPLFKRMVAVGLVSKEDPFLHYRQDAPKSAKLVFASRHQTDPLWNRKRLWSTYYDKVQLLRRERKCPSTGSTRPKTIWSEATFACEARCPFTRIIGIESAMRIISFVIFSESIITRTSWTSGPKQRSADPGGDCSSGKREDPGTTPKNSSPRTALLNERIANPRLRANLRNSGP